MFIDAKQHRLFAFLISGQEQTGRKFVSVSMLYILILCSVALIGIANELLETLHVGRRVKKLADINASFFVTLYEGLCAEPVKGMHSEAVLYAVV